MSHAAPEKVGGAGKGLENAPSTIVVQPSKVEYASFLDGISKMSERTGEDHSGDWSSAAGGGQMIQTGGSAARTGTSARDQAVANLPAAVIMQKQLAEHIRVEVKKLRKQALQISRMSRPGAAYKLNELYARIRHLNAILAELFEASMDVLKRLFVRVFIDKQTIQ